MKVQLLLILLSVIQFIGQSRAEVNLNDNEDNGSVDRNAAKHRARKCRMERYGMCSEIGDDSIEPEHQEKLTKRKAKCVAVIVDLGRMARTHTLIGTFLSKWLKSKKNKDNV